MKSGLPSLSMSIVGTWMAPVRGSITFGVNAGVFQSVVLFSSSVTLPVVRQPKLPTIDVEVAVAVEVGGAGVRRARQLRRQRHRDVRAVGAPPQPVDRAVAVVGRLERAEVGDEEVAAPVLVEIDRLDVGGVAQPGDRLQRVGILGQAEQHGAGPHLAGEDVEALVAVHVEQPHVRDGDGARRRGPRHRALLERHRLAARRPARPRAPAASPAPCGRSSATAAASRATAAGSWSRRPVRARPPGSASCGPSRRARRSAAGCRAAAACGTPCSGP